MDEPDFFSELKQSLLEEISNIISKYSECNYENALKLNQELQKQVQRIQYQMHILLKSVMDKYSANEALLMSRSQPCKGISQRGAWLRGYTFYFKGNLYFKDRRGRCGPNTEDYLSRVNAGEMFPMDFNLRARHIWTLRDKSIIIKAVKTQLIEHFNLSKTSCVRGKELNIAVHSLKLVELLASLDETNKGNDFQIDFHQISVNDLRSRHSRHSCEAMWLQYLQPNINREDWSKEEDNQLMESAAQYNYQDWRSIAATMDRRSEYQCFIRYQTELSYLNKNGAATLNNKHLLAVVKENSINGVINWTAVMAQFPDARKSTVVGRYFYQLNPHISREKFKPEEDILLIAAVEEYNGKFHCIPKTLFPNRSLTQLRSRYRNTILSRGKVNSWSVQDDKSLMEFVRINGASSWVQCAEYLKNHTRQSCRTRYYTISRYLEKYPNASLENLPCRRSRVSKNDVNTENWTDKLVTIMTPKPTEEGPTQKKCKRSYMQRLRPMQLEFYNFFKYSYNFRIGQDVTTKWPQNDYGLKIMASSLRHTHCMTNSNYKFDKTLPLPLRYVYDDMLARLPPEISIQPFYNLPMNWCTAIGFRAICIHASQKSIKPTNELRPPPVNDALLTFRQRFRAIFYNTILLSRLEPSRIPGLQDAMNLIVVPNVSKEPRQYPTHELTKVRVYEPLHHANTTTTSSITNVATRNQGLQHMEDYNQPVELKSLKCELNSAEIQRIAKEQLASTMVKAKKSKRKRT